jgi:hypothetical protein
VVVTGAEDVDGGKLGAFIQLYGAVPLQIPQKLLISAGLPSAFHCSLNAENKLH